MNKIDNNSLELLNLAYEIEGLLLLQINRGDETTDEMRSLLRSKAEELARRLQPDSEGESHITLPDEEEYNDDFVDETTVAETGSEEAHHISGQSVAPEPQPAPLPYSDAQSIAESAQLEETEDAEPSMTLDEKLSRQRAQNIFKAFTLNDKFRFRRELFRNSQDEFDETLNVIATMSDFDEAEEYFYNDLCWDPDSDDVKEFMAIVRRHF